jgi:hypothetical protein
MVRIGKAEIIVKTLNNRKIIPILLSLMMILIAIPSLAATDETPVLLGTTENFAVLTGSTITNTGTTTISGDAGADVGLAPGTSITGAAGPAPDFITLLDGGLYYTGTDPVAVQAKTDLVDAYDDAAGRTPVTTTETELGGKILIPGVYHAASGTFGITGTLTLDAQGDPNGVFIFLMDMTLTTASDSVVSIINSALYCRVFWKVGSSATLGTNSTFVGHIFAYDSITATTGAYINGQLLARTGAVTLDSNTIINVICATLPTPTPTATVTATATLPTATIRVQTIPLPKTGDNSGNTSWLSLLTISAGALLIVTGIIRYSHRQQKMKP